MVLRLVCSCGWQKRQENNDPHGKLTGYNAEGGMPSIPGELKRVLRESKLDITFHYAPSVESGYLAKMYKELLEK